MHDLTATVIRPILKIEVSPIDSHGNSNLQTLKKVQNLRKTTPRPLISNYG